MIDLGQVSVPTVGGRRRSRRLLISLLVGVVAIAAGTITAVSVSLHYLHAPALETDGGGWLPDNARPRSIQAGQYTASVVPPRPGHAQTFQMDFYNPSSVTQTVLGLTDGEDLGNAETKAEPVHLTISTKPSFPGDPATLTYTSKPVVIPPHQQFTLRLTHDTGRNWAPCRSEFWNALSLQVRVGAFTRTETIDFGPLIMELRQPGPGC